MRLSRAALEWLVLTLVIFATEYLLPVVLHALASIREPATDLDWNEPAE